VTDDVKAGSENQSKIGDSRFRLNKKHNKKLGCMIKRPRKAKSGKEKDLAIAAFPRDRRTDFGVSKLTVRYGIR
jgi:hypothetical protein